MSFVNIGDSYNYLDIAFPAMVRNKVSDIASLSAHARRLPRSPDPSCDIVSSRKREFSLR
jgi:hypothetical protein